MTSRIRIAPVAGHLDDVFEAVRTARDHQVRGRDELRQRDLPRATREVGPRSSLPTPGGSHTRPTSIRVNG